MIGTWGRRWAWHSSQTRARFSPSRPDAATCILPNWLIRLKTEFRRSCMRRWVRRFSAVVSAAILSPLRPAQRGCFD